MYEDRGDGRGGGHWAFDQFVNSAPAFDFSDPTWQQPFGALTITPNIGAGPLASIQGTRVDDTVGGRILYILDTTVQDDQHAYNSLWVRDSSIDPTLGGSWNAGDDSYGVGFGGGAGWRRISSLWVKSSGLTFGVKVRLYPAGATPDPRSNSGAITYDATKTGAIEVWGAQATLAVSDVPLVDGSTGKLTMTVDPTHALLPNGDLYIEGAYLFQGLRYTEWASPAWTLGDQYAINIDTANGPQSLFWNINNGTWIANKGDGTATAGIALFNHLYYDHEVRYEFYNRPSAGDGGANIWFNGCRVGGAVNLSNMRWTAVPQAAPTAISLNSNAGAANSFMSAPVTELRRIDQPIVGRRDSQNPEACEGVILGDSILAAHAYAGPMTGAYIYTFDEGRSRLGIVSYANTGDTINDQYSAWLAGPQRGAADVKWVIIQVGANDLYADQTAAQMSTDYSALIADINTQNPTAKVLLYPMTPMRASLTAGQYVQWLAANANIDGSGVNPVTGTFVLGAAWASMGDVSNNLLTQYNEPATDGVHPNDIARITIQAATFRADLIANGLL